MKQDIKKHIIKSEICDKNGAWNDKAMTIGDDAQKTIDRLFKKHKGQLSILALRHIFTDAVYMAAFKATALDSPGNYKTKI